MTADPFRGGIAFRDLAEHARENYLKFDYTKGTKQEAKFLQKALALPDSALVLDVACGVARHHRLLPWRVVGADLTRALLDVARRRAQAQGQAQLSASMRNRAALAPAPAPAQDVWELVQADARSLPLRPVFDGAWSVCEGAFGLLPDDAAHVAMLRSVRAALKPGAPFLLSAMSVFTMAHDESFDLRTNVMTDVHDVSSPEGKVKKFELATRAFAPREVLGMAREAGFEVEHLWGGITGAYETRPLAVDDPEMLVLMRNPTR